VNAESNLYLRRLAVGQMANFVYLVGCRATRQCLVVDPAWEIDAILDAAAADEMELTGVLATHYHPDHVGGEVFGLEIAGLRDLLERVSVPIHVNQHEKEGLALTAGVSLGDLVAHAGGDEVEVGHTRVKLLHTPGHTPGGQCFLVDGHLISGDTLFVQGCGRVDLPGGDPAALWKSLTGVLARLPDETRVYPGHAYGPVPDTTIGAEKEHNPYLQFDQVSTFLRAMGYSA